MRASDAYEKYAHALGKTTAALTLAEKKQAFLNECMKAGNRLISTTNMEQDTYTERLTRSVNVTLESVKRVLGASVLPLITAITGLVIVLANAFLSLPDPIKNTLGISWGACDRFGTCWGCPACQQMVAWKCPSAETGVSRRLFGRPSERFPNILSSSVLSLRRRPHQSLTTEEVEPLRRGILWLPPPRYFLNTRATYCLAFTAIAGVVWVIWDIFNKGWENSALNKVLKRDRTDGRRNDETTRIVKLFLLTNPITAPYVIVDDVGTLLRNTTLKTI